MDNTSTTTCVGLELTCARSTRLASDRVYVGTADGRVCAIAAPSVQDPRHHDEAGLPLTRVYWSLRLCIHAITVSGLKNPMNYHFVKLDQE